MADFQTWNRQVLPQGNLATPPAAPSLAESFGQGVTDLAKAAAATADTIQQADDWYKAKKWEIVDQPKAVALVNDLQIKIAEQLPGLKAKAAAGLEDYPDLIDDAIVSATEEALKDNPDPQFQRYVRGQMGDFRVLSVTAGIQEKASATLIRDANNLQGVVDGQAKLVSEDFSRVDGAMNLVGDWIKGNQNFSADRKSELDRINKRAIVYAGLNGLKERDPDAALKELNSGRFEEILTYEDIQRLRSDAEAEKERRAIHARNEADRERVKSLGIAQALYDTAINDAWGKGSFDFSVVDKVKNAFGEDAPKMLAKLDNQRQMGLDRIAIQGQPLKADSRLLQSLSRAVEDSNDQSAKELANERYASAKTLIDAKRSAVGYDPAGYVTVVNQDAASAWNAVAERPDNAQAVKQAFSITQQALLKLGISAKELQPVPREVADAILAKVKSGGVQAIAAVQQGFDKVSRPYLISAIAPKAGRYITTALMLEHPEQRRAQIGLLAMSRNPDLAVNVLDNRLDGDPERLRNAVEDNIGRFAQAFSDTDERRQVYGNFFESAKVLTLYYMSGEHPLQLDEAASLAASDLLGSQYGVGKVKSQEFLVPKPYNAGDVSFGLDRYLDDLSGKLLDKPADAPNTPNETLAASLRQYGRWVLLPDETGLELQYPSGQPAKIGGKEIVLTPSAAIAISDEWKQRIAISGGIIWP